MGFAMSRDGVEFRPLLMTPTLLVFRAVGARIAYSSPAGKTAFPAGLFHALPGWLP
jgi:hypothetical protein